MCDISRFTATGATVRNSSFHHSTANIGRMKASDSLMAGNTWSAPCAPNLEVKGLEGWLEGPMLINNVTVVNNTFIGLGTNGAALVHPSQNATNVTAEGNIPAGKMPPPPPAPLPPGPPSSVVGFC
jgi:hypothetical protein